MSWNRIHNYRVITGKTLAEIAKEIGVSVGMLMMVKTGKRSLSEKALYRLEQAEIRAGIIREAPTNFPQTVNEDEAEYGRLDVRKEMNEIKAMLKEAMRRLDDLNKKM